MARPEIPSIVVHNGSASNPGSPRMEDISKQTSLSGEEVLEEDLGSCEVGDLVLPSPATSSPHTASLPLTPSSPSPIVSSCSPSVGTPSSSPAHCLRPISPTLCITTSSESTNPDIPQGPGPGGGEEGVDSNSESAGVSMAVGPVAPHGVQEVPSRSRSLELNQGRSTDSEKDSPVNGSTGRQRSFHSDKLKLLQRSHAMREDTSPPPEIFHEGRDGSPMLHTHSFSNSSNNLTVQGPPMGGPGGPNRRRLRHQGSSQGSFDGSSPCLSRDSSMEYTDSTGVDLLQFIIQTLHKNQKDRMLLLKIERELISFVKDPKRTHHKFPQMSSYQRMLVHRCAAYFGLDHNVDQVGTCVIVNKTRNTRIPEIRFKDHIRDELMIPSDEPRRSILRRGFQSFEDNNFRSPDRLRSIESRRSKSFEEREEEYEKVRRRIFSDEYFSSMDGMSDSSGRRCHYPFERRCRRNSHDEPRWVDPRHFAMGDSESHRKNHDMRIRPYRLPKGESFESHDALNPRCLRPPVFKSHSFGGYSGGVTVLSRGDSVASNPSSRLSKQDSTGSRFSDHSSSSGYKTQRQDTSSTNVSNTLSTTPSPTTGPPGQHQHPSFGQHAGIWGGDGDSQPVMWAVTDMEAVPQGAMLINPQSGQPYVNSDGTIYRYDPNNPPIISKPLPPKGPMTKDRETTIDKKLKDVTETDTATSTNVPAPSSSPGSGGSEPPSSVPQESEGTLVSCSSPDKQFGPQRISSADSMQDESKTSSIENDEGSDGTSNCSKGVDSRTKQSIRDDEDHTSYSQFMSQASVDGRPYSRDSVSDVSRELRGLMLSGGSGNDGSQDIVSPPSISSGTPVPHNFVMPRHQYTQAIYYVPPSSVANLSGGGMKYVYPQYHPMTHAQGNVQPPSHPGSSMGSHSHPSGPAGPHPGSQPGHHMQPHSSVGGIPPMPSMPQSMVGHGPHHPQTVGEANAPLPPGYLPGNYTVLAYPSSGLLGTVPSTAGGHESGGTTYYCHIPGPPASPMTPGSSSTINATSGTAAGHSTPSNPPSLQQYNISSTTSASTYPVALGFYSGAGMNNNGMYQPPGIQGFTGGMYAAPQSHHGGLMPQTPQTSVSYRAQTPPHTPCTQGVNLPIAFNSAGGAVPPSHGVGNQYIAVLPPQQPHTPTTHTTQLYPTFFRPSVQMISGSTGTPPPQPVLHYGGISGPVPLPPGSVTPHPPVFGKPYGGGLLSGFMGEPQGGGGAGKEDCKRYSGSGGGSMPHIRGMSSVAPVPPTHHHQHHHHHLLPRPYSSFMQNCMERPWGRGGLRPSTPILIPGNPIYRTPLLTPGGSLIVPYTFTRSPKLKNLNDSRNN